ncbi:hypothetical protein [Kribbella sp. NPDC003557]|uniref:hypothetical protein n=1 Tax=Kribbella sp. NPDC003557 TaxID=3154449 RepID=UPI0033B7F55A
MSVLRSAAAGLGLGLAWGVAARVWMRLISTEPEFTWAGTLVILALTGGSGLLLGVLYGLRRAGRSRWWRILAAPCLLTFAGPGILFLPAFLLGGLLHLRHRWARIIGAVGIALGELALWALSRTDPVNPWYLYGGFLVLSLALSAGGAELYRPRPFVRARRPVSPGRAEPGGRLRRMSGTAG